MPDRLAELRRQHALIRTHLDWLEEEIARLEPLTPVRRPPADVALTPTPPPPLPSLPSGSGSLALQQARLIQSHAGATAPTADTSDGAADAILAEYRVPPEAVRRDLRHGCLLYFAVGLVVVVGGLFGLWYLLRR